MKRLTVLIARLASGSWRFGRKEPLLAPAVLSCFLAFYFFGDVVEEVLEGDAHAIDVHLLLALREKGNIADPLGPPWLAEMMRDLSGMGGIVILTLVTMASTVYLLLKNARGQAVYLLCAVGTAIILSNALKRGFDRPRPALVPHGSYTAMASFPSGHSLMAAVVYLTLGAILAEAHPQFRFKIYVVALAVMITMLVGISRVYLGVHWPSDVLAGWLVGAGWALLFWIIGKYLKIRRNS